MHAEADNKNQDTFLSQISVADSLRTVLFFLSYRSWLRIDGAEAVRPWMPAVHAISPGKRCRAEAVVLGVLLFRR